MENAIARPCPLYTRMMIQEALGLLRLELTVR